MIATTLSVMVVDCGSSDRQPVPDALAEQGFRCEVASSPSEAAPYLDGADFDTVVIYERAASDCLCEFVEATRAKLPFIAIIVVQTEYDGEMECGLFDLDVDDVITCEYSPPNLAIRAALRAKRRRKMTMS